MSTQSIQAEVLGETVTAQVLAVESTASYGQGPRDQYLIDVGGSTYRVDEAQVDG